MKNNIYSKIKKAIVFFGIIAVGIFIYLVIQVRNEDNNIKLEAQSNEYIFPSPGMMPDSKVYKLKVLRNKIAEKMIIGYVKKIEFDLLMADKTIYASKLLMKKGKVDLSKETVLKGENYYSMLVQEYNKALLSHEQIPFWLDRKITLATIKHREVFKQLEDTVTGENKKTFQIVSEFSKINYDFIAGLRNPKK